MSQQTAKAKGEKKPSNLKAQSRLFLCPTILHQKSTLCPISSLSNREIDGRSYQALAPSSDWAQLRRPRQLPSHRLVSKRNSSVNPTYIRAHNTLVL